MNVVAIDIHFKFADPGPELDFRKPTGDSIRLRASGIESLDVDEQG